MKNLCLFLPNISHAGRGCRGNIPSICEKYEFETILYDRPRDGFDEKNVLTDIKEILHHTKYEKTILISNSFGDIIGRKLLRELEKDGNNTVYRHISICGVSNPENISTGSKFLLRCTITFRKYICHHTRLIRIVATMFNKKPSPGVSKENLKANIQSAVAGINKGIIARSKLLLSHKEPRDILATHCYILLSENDNNFTRPIQNAETIASYYQHAALINLGKAGHGSLVEMPEKYDPIIEDIMNGAI